MSCFLVLPKFPNTFKWPSSGPLYQNADLLKDFAMVAKVEVCRVVLCYGKCPWPVMWQRDIAELQDKSQMNPATRYIQTTREILRDERQDAFSKHYAYS